VEGKAWALSGVNFSLYERVTSDCDEVRFDGTEALKEGLTLEARKFHSQCSHAGLC
jgi:hypothetical protein